MEAAGVQGEIDLAQDGRIGTIAKAGVAGVDDDRFPVAHNGLQGPDTDRLLHSL